MKKFRLTLLMVAAIGLFATSCKKDNDDNPTPTPVDKTPSINFKGGAEYTSDDVTVSVGDTLKIGITASSNTNSKSKLVSVKYEVVANNITIATGDSTFKATAYDHDYLFPIHNAGTARVTFTVTDKKGETASKSLEITANPATTVVLSEANPFTWKREGGNPATGLDPFGLSWTANVRGDVKAKIVKNGATRLVILPAESWTLIKTVKDLKTSITYSPDTEAFHEISVNQSSDYDFVLGVENGEDYHLIHITRANVQMSIGPSGGGGTTIEIKGDYKSTMVSTGK